MQGNEHRIGEQVLFRFKTKPFWQLEQVLVELQLMQFGIVHCMHDVPIS